MKRTATQRSKYVPDGCIAKSESIRVVMLVVGLLAAPSALVGQSPDAEDAHVFNAVARLLTNRCIDCHQGDQPSGGLDLTTANRFAAGGDSGPLRPFESAGESLLWERISSGEMPPEERLSSDELALIRKWLDEGAGWDDRKLDAFDLSTEQRAGRDWWALQPLQSPAIPVVSQSQQPANPIDAFVQAKLSKHGLVMSQQADPITLIRRLSLHLHGLPPSQDALARVPQTTAEVNRWTPTYDSMVNEFLESPRYGERWARHWLDLARFGESQGFERDKSRPNAWRYRDWVIKSLNQDMPYDRFAWMQIAGDCDSDLGRDGIIATGFLVGGAWDEVGQNQQSEAMRAVVRQDELEDYVATVGQAFLGLTIHCARCHDHKFDPIRQSEYYALCSALDGVRHGDRDVTDPALVKASDERKASVQNQLMQLLRDRAKVDAQIVEALIVSRQRTDASQAIAQIAIPQPIAHWDFESGLEDRYGNLNGVAQGGARIESGGLVLDGREAHVLTQPTTEPLIEKTLVATVTLDHLDQSGGAPISVLGQNATFDAIVFGEREPKRWMSGSDHFVRTRDVGGEEESLSEPQKVQIAITYEFDGRITIFRNGNVYGNHYRTSPHTFAQQTTRVGFGIRLLPVGGNRMFAGRVEDASLFDRALTPQEVRWMYSGARFIPREALGEFVSTELIEKREELNQRVRQLRSIDTDVERQFAYAVKPRQPSQPTHRLRRGSTASPAEVILPGGVKSVRGVNADFRLAANAPEAERRRHLANWITSERNPLFARVIVNRIWQHHFGEGIVRTPSDFGFTGGQPSHPLLLDYLATQLIESGWSLKSIQRLIVTSATWQQAVQHDANAISKDAENRLLWRGNRTRLDAESLRDSVLQVSGKLNLQLCGPPYQDFKTFNFNSQFYDVLDREGDEFNRRTIYRMLIRSGRHRLLDAFDCPDPSSIAPKRSRTTTPLQSLSLMNHPFAIRMSEHFSKRVQNEAGDHPRDQVRRAVELAWCRAPIPEEATAFEHFVRENDLASLCRVLINSNEFLYVD